MICDTKEACPVPSSGNYGMETGYGIVGCNGILARTQINAPNNEAALRGITRCAANVRNTKLGVLARSRGRTWFPMGIATRAYFMHTTYEQVRVQASGQKPHTRYYVRVDDLINPRTVKIPLFEVTF